MADNTKHLMQVYGQPGAAMSAILDRGSLLYASLAVLTVSAMLRGGPWLSFRFYTPLLVLAMVYVPATLALSKLLAGVGGGLGTVFRRDYAPLLTCTAMAWAAAHLPLGAASWLAPATWAMPLTGAAGVYFLVLMFFVVRTVFGAENGAAAAAACLSWIPTAAAAFLWVPLQFLLGWLASPCLLFFVYRYLTSEIDTLGAGLRNRQNFRRMLEAAAVNPHDGEAQYQLGLIYQQRRQSTEAIERFQRAVAIDPEETDAHFQWGRIAREQGRLKDALEQFQTVLDQDPKHHQHEILRELGAVYATARQYGDAERFLADYVERREYDPEGLVYRGQALEGLGRNGEARATYERAAEAARTAPRYRRRLTAKWGRLAQKRLRALGDRA